VVRHPHLVHHPVLDPQQLHPVGHHHPGLDRGAAADDMRPTEMPQPAFCGQFRGDLDKQLRLQLRQVSQLPAHPARGVMLGEPGGGEHVRENVAVLLGGRRVGRIVGTAVDHAGRVGLLAIQRVADRRFVRLVVSGQGAVHQATRGEQPTLAVSLHDERVVAAQRIRPDRPRWGLVGRWFGLVKVRHIMAGPLAALIIPPHQRFALAPRTSLWISRSAVVQNPAVGRPYPAPLQGVFILVQTGLAARRLVDPIGVDTAVNPATTRGGAVRLRLQVTAEQAACGQVMAIDVT
jgi:hypothetical protein